MNYFNDDQSASQNLVNS